MDKKENKQWDIEKRIEVTNEDLKILIPDAPLDFLSEVSNTDSLSFTPIPWKNFEKVGIDIDDIPCKIYNENGKIFLELDISSYIGPYMKEFQKKVYGPKKD